MYHMTPQEPIRRQCHIKVINMTFIIRRRKEYKDRYANEVVHELRPDRFIK